MHGINVKGSVVYKSVILSPNFCFTGKPDPDVTFHRNGKPINPRKEKRAKIDWDLDTDINTLRITKAVKEDAGEYTIKAENERGVIEFTVNVIIGKASEIEIIESTKTLTVTEQTIVDGEVTESVVKEKTVEKSVGGETIVESTVTESETVEAVVSEEPKPAEEVVTEEKVEAVESVEVEAAKTSESVEVKSEAVEITTEEKSEEKVEVTVEESEAGAPKMEVAPKPVIVDVGETIIITCKFVGR